MDSLTLSSVGILVKDGNGRTMLCLDNAASCYDGDIGNLMIIDAPDIDRSIRFLNDTNVVTSYATIGASVNERTNST